MSDDVKTRVAALIRDATFDDPPEDIAEMLDQAGLLRSDDDADESDQDDDEVVLYVSKGTTELWLIVDGEVHRLDHPPHLPEAMSDRDKVIALALCSFAENRIRHADCDEDLS